MDISIKGLRSPVKMPAGMRATVSKGEAGTLLYTFDLCGEGYATVGVGKRSDGSLWATVYGSSATNEDVHKVILRAIKRAFQSSGYDFAYGFAKTTRLKGLLYKLGISEREKYIATYDLEKGDPHGEEDQFVSMDGRG